MPEKTFRDFLVRNVFQIEKIIFQGDDLCFREAIRPLRGLIASLDAESKEKLEKQYKQLVSFETNVCSREAIEQIFWEIISYLHSTYLV